jgi:hypothetical protein
MRTLQAIILGMLLVLTPSALFLAWVLWQDGKLPPRDQLELSRHRFENTASDLIDCADHINDEITTRATTRGPAPVDQFLQAGPCHGGLHRHHGSQAASRRG